MTKKWTSPNLQFLPLKPGQEVKIRFVRQRLGSSKKLRARARGVRTRRLRSAYHVTRKMLARHWVYNPKDKGIEMPSERPGCPVCKLNVERFACLLAVTPVRMRYTDFHPEMPTRVW